MRPDIHALVGEIYACVGDPAHWEGLLPQIASTIGGHAAALQHQHRSDAGLATGFTHGLDPAWLARYLNDWDAENPWRSRGIQYGLSRPEAWRYTAIHASRLTDPREFRKSAIFNECMIDADLYDCVCLPLFVDDHPLWIAVFCGARKDCFEADDIEVARYLAAHIGRAASLSSNLVSKRGKARKGAPSGPLIVVEDSRFIEANVALYGADPLKGRSAHDSARLLLNGEEVSRRFGQFLQGDAVRRSRGALCTFELGGGHVLSVYRPPSGSARARAEYVLMFDRDAAGRGRADRCAEALSISKGDAELAMLFAEGLSPEDVARACGGSVEDYRKKMASLYKRLGVKDQGALVLRVLAATRSVGVMQAD